jgi:ribosome-associated protein
MQAEQLARVVVSALEEGKAQDLRVLDVRAISAFTDFMIVATGRSDRQVRALADKVVMEAKKAGVTPLGVEGKGQAEWILIDLADVVVHAMQPATRDFYQLEKLWSDAKRPVARVK